MLRLENNKETTWTSFEHLKKVEYPYPRVTLNLTLSTNKK